MKIITTSLATIIFSTILASTSVAATQLGEDSKLHKTVHDLDFQLFDSFNKCTDTSELEIHASFFAPDIEFYHDNGGVTWTRDAMLANTQKYACGNYTRELIESTFNVSPIKSYGAISTGVHRFCQIATKDCAGTADFVMVWRNANGKWEVTRSLSFGHRPTQDEVRSSIIPDQMSINDILQANHVTSVSLALINNGVLSFAGAYGEAKRGVPATPSTLYNIASMTKPITAEVALRLAAMGKISLDEKMSEYWADPDIAKDPRRNLLTPRIALTHRTGFPNWRDGKLKFVTDPGKTFGYSGEGYEYLATFILNKTKHPIDYWADQLVFLSNGMRQTTYTAQSWLNGRIALPHDTQGSELPPQISSSAVASDNIFSTPSDYALFIASVMNGQGITKELSSDRSKVQTDRKAELCKKIPKNDCPAEIGMSLGWELFLINGKRYFMHTGSDEGTFTFGYFSPDTRVGAVIFTNSSNGSKAILPILQMIGKDKTFVNFLEKLVRTPGI